MRRIGYAYGLDTASTVELPITVESAKLDRRIFAADDDAAVERWIRSAWSRGELYLGRGLLTQTWKLALDEFIDAVDLPMAAPLQSITSVKYYDTSGVLQTLSTSSYQVDTLSEPGRMLRAPNQSWPALQSGRKLAVEILYVVGWTAANLIPAEIIDALYLWIGDRDEFRAGVLAGTIVSRIPSGVESMLAGQRRFWCEPKTK